MLLEIIDQGIDPTPMTEIGSKAMVERFKALQRRNIPPTVPGVLPPPHPSSSSNPLQKLPPIPQLVVINPND